MSRAPSMPMFWDAYLADTTHLSTEEHGAYLLLLGAMWRRNGFVPDSDKDNARILGMTVAKWRKVKERLSDFLVIENGQITQKNLLKIWKITQEKIEANRANGARGGRPKTKENNDLEKPNGYVSDNPNANRIETIPEPEPYITQSKDCATDAGEGFWIDCVQVLTDAGRTNRQARALLGKWSKTKSRDDVRAIVLSAAQAADPVAVIEAAMTPPKPPDKRSAAVSLIATGNPAVCRGITPSLARELLRDGMVTETQLRKAQVQW